MTQHFSSTLHISRDDEKATVRLSIATSDHRVDEITLAAGDFKQVAKALWDRSPHYAGCPDVQVRHKDNRFSISVQTGVRTRTVYRLSEAQVTPVLGQFMAEVGGI